MGLYEQKICIFTGFEATPVLNSLDRVEYTVVVNNKKHFISLSIDALAWREENKFFQVNEHKFFGLLYNNDWFLDESIYITIGELEKLLILKEFPQSPTEKFENVFLKLCSFHNQDGDCLYSPDENYRHFNEFVSDDWVLHCTIGN